MSRAWSVLVVVAALALLWLPAPGDTEPSGEASLLVQLAGSYRAFAEPDMRGRASGPRDISFEIPALDVAGETGVLAPWSRSGLPAGEHALRFIVDGVEVECLVALRQNELTQLVLDTHSLATVQSSIGIDLIDVLSVGSTGDSLSPFIGFPDIYDEKPYILMRARVEYPEHARDLEIEGVVVIGADVDTAGHVVGAEVLHGVQQLDEAALEAVRSWEFAPARLFGRPVPSEVPVAVLFTLTGRPVEWTCPDWRAERQ